jgi:MinD-like ATPase involved in chromosome partitioning or flagellar assembly
MNSNQVLAVWGCPNSGATTLSVKIAKELESQKRSVALILCDEETPMLPILMPNGKQVHLSLGELLSQTRISQAEILKHFVPYSNNTSLLGYRLDDNEMTYPQYSPETASKLLTSLSRLVDNIIIDCSHHLASNVITRVGIQSADVTLRVVNANLKCSTYIRSQRHILSDSQMAFDQQVVVLNNVLPGQDETAFSNVFGNISYTIPHTPSLMEQYETGKLSESLFGREAKHFEPVIREIVKDVFIK